ncbi:DUF3332 domain-containing protein [Porphyromonadaceae bacterium OttesenSCG-928-L07]|nr:DUF3332 domain-containing protein [Porphyromonadaceae bacterium OttesenSCG-928-L07]MDL2251939.1 DUF3332 domain-containing protein [Odoribacter sp. OttesenSCG-928-J03]
MKRIITKITTLVVVVTLSLTLSGCFGSFALLNKVHTWNDSVSDKKFVKELVFLAMCIIPVYELATLGDALIFNTIEFWGDTNPIAMGADDVEESEIKHKGQLYKMIKKQNSLTIVQGDAQADFRYFPEEKTWYLMDGEEQVKVVEMKGKSVFTYLPNDKVLVFDETNVDMVAPQVMAARN